MAVGRRRVLRRADERARGRGRHRDERQDDDRLPPARRCSRRPVADRASWGRSSGWSAASGARRPSRRRRRSTSRRLFREMVDAGDRSVALEASSHGAALQRLDRVRFDVLVFTNLSQDHLDLHGTMEEYFEAKRRLFAARTAASGRGERRRRVGATAGRRARGHSIELRSSPSGSTRERTCIPTISS